MSKKKKLSADEWKHLYEIEHALAIKASNEANGYKTELNNVRKKLNAFYGAKNMGDSK